MGQGAGKHLFFRVLLHPPGHQISFRAQHIGQQQFVPVPVRFQRFVQGHFVFQAAGAPQIHQYLIFDTPAGVGRQLDFFVWVKGVHCFNQPDGADGNQVLHAHRRVFKLFRDEHNQTQIPLDQDGAGGAVVPGQPGHQRQFLLRGQWLGQGIGPADIIHAVRMQMRK